MESRPSANEESWEKAASPNYSKHNNLKFPYSECPFLGIYRLIKIPKKGYIDHVDYWGIGRYKTKEGWGGFKDCYNVNLTYQIVQYSDNDKRKIPNRIPVESDTNCITESYIKSNSVKLVTILGQPISESCASDIARMINDTEGMVVAYGFNRNDEDIETLADKLQSKPLVCCPNFVLPESLRMVIFDRHITFLNLTTCTDILYNNITSADFNSAVNLSLELNKAGRGSVVSDVLEQLLQGVNPYTMTFVYSLWAHGGEDIVTSYFPIEFQYICRSDNVRIISKYYTQPLKLDVHTNSSDERLAWGTAKDETSERLVWNISVEPKYVTTVNFKIKNKEYSMFLNLDTNVDSNGDRKCWGAQGSDGKRYDWLLQVTRHKGEILFFIVNAEYKQALKLDANVDDYGDRVVWGHNGNYLDKVDYFGWIVEKV